MVAAKPKSPTRKPTAKPTGAVAAATASQVVETQNVKLEPTGIVRRRELVERVVARSGLKPNAVKSVLDPLFEEMGNALSAGEMLNIQPFGKVTVNRQKVMDDREILICKIRRNGGAKPKMV